MPTRMDKYIIIIGCLVSDLNKVGQRFLSAKTMEELKKLEEAREDHLATKIKITHDQPSATQPPNKNTFVGSRGAPPNDFRFLSVIPTSEDIMDSGKAVFLRAAKQKGQYDNGEHYLDVQFRLLREDLIRPLRDGIQQYRMHEQQQQRGEKKRLDLFVYKDVRMGIPEMHKLTGELIVYAQLKNDSPNNVAQWGNEITAEHCGMDASQFDALRYALNSELAIIQGPPGTGKTYIGLQLAKLLFANETVWNAADDHRPMLVVCYTNHALDQFLEGIHRFLEDGIVRIGGRSKNKNLEKFMLPTLRRNFDWNGGMNNKDDIGVKMKYKDERKNFWHLQKRLQKMGDELRQLESGLAGPRILKKVLEEDAGLGEEQLKNISELLSDKNTEKKLLFNWLVKGGKYPAMNLLTMRELTVCFPEVLAKNAYAQCLFEAKIDSSWEIKNWILSRPEMQVDAMSRQVDRRVEHWPILADIHILRPKGRIHVPCIENCKRILVCGHECGSMCSKVCPPCKKPCETACGHSQCGIIAVNGRKAKPKRKGVASQSNGKKGRLCGDPCLPCAEGCLNRCEHRQCSKACWLPCDVAPCQEKCLKELPCTPKAVEPKKKEVNGREDESDEKDMEVGPPVVKEQEHKHQCIGVCGEECPEICKICQPEKFAAIQEVLFGTEDEEDARFIQLTDCGHVLEVTGLDQWIQIQSKVSVAEDSSQQQQQDGQQEPRNSSTSTEIVQIDCPKCKTSIRRSQRYISLLNKRAYDIEQVKHHMRGKDKHQLIQEWKHFKDNQLMPEFNKIVKVNDSIASKIKVVQAFRELLKSFDNVNETQVTVHWMTTARNILRIASQLIKHYNELMVEQLLTTPISPTLPHLNKRLKEHKIGHNLKDYLTDEILYLVNRIKGPADIKSISQTTLRQVGQETDRFCLLFNLMKYLVRVSMKNEDFRDSSGLGFLLKALNGSKEYGGENAAKLKAAFEELRNSHPVSGFNLTEAERLEIVKALDSSVTKWYKCSKGHIYGIGNCGRANQQSFCPECKEAIGGESHRLVPTSQEANEMRQGLPEVPQIDPFVRFAF